MHARPHVTRSAQILGVPLLLAGVVAAGAAQLAPSHSAAAHHATAAPPTALPTGLPKTGTLSGVAALTASNAWSVGQTLTGKTVALHWNGASWKQVPSPTPRGGGAFYAVSATSASNAWAVGGNNGKPFKTLIAHWNGHTWKQVPGPSVGGALFGVSAVSASDAWAVGCAGDCYQGFAKPMKTLILHWNGHSWTRVTSPSPGTATSLSAVSATSASNAWAVGCTADCFISSATPQTVILHWNGTAWKQVPSPVGGTTGALNGVAAVSAGNAWVVGCTGHCFGPDANPGTLILHWNGGTWQKVTAPSPSGGSVLTGVAARAGAGAWAVGYTRSSGKTLILRWSGTSWSRVASPTPAHGGQLLGTAIGSPGSAFAVGASVFGNLLLEHWNGTTWK